MCRSKRIRPSTLTRKSVRGHTTLPITGTDMSRPLRRQRASSIGLNRMRRSRRVRSCRRISLTKRSRNPNLDADVIAERLRGRFAGFLTGEGRGIIEARCRDALQDHTSWLVNQITREVALALETELTGWVREAVDQEIARRSGSA